MLSVFYNSLQLLGSLPREEEPQDQERHVCVYINTWISLTDP